VFNNPSFGYNSKILLLKFYLLGIFFLLNKYILKIYTIKKMSIFLFLLNEIIYIYIYIHFFFQALFNIYLNLNYILFLKLK